MPVCGFIRIYLAVYGLKIIVRLREIINLARGYRFLRVKRLGRLSGNFILLKASFFNKGLPFRVCEQPIRRQNRFCSFVLFLRSCGLCEEKYDYSGADPENSERGTLLSQGAGINILHKAQGRLATFNSCTCDWGDQQKAQNFVDIGVEA